MKEISSVIRCLDASGFAHVYIGMTAEGIVLFDTGFPWDGPRIWRELCREGYDHLIAILLTHHDADHVGGAPYLQKKSGAPVYIGAQDMPFFDGAPKLPRAKNLLVKMAGVRRPQLLQPLENANLTDIDALPAPGHTPGHTVFLMDGCLITGDLFSNKNGHLENLLKHHADIRQNAQSLLKAIEFDAEILCPAHGDPIENTAATRTALRRLTEERQF